MCYIYKIMYTQLNFIIKLSRWSNIKLSDALATNLFVQSSSCAMILQNKQALANKACVLYI